MDDLLAPYASFDSPAIYRIRVQGNLGVDWGERLGGLSVQGLVDKDGQTITILEGELSDQAALAGVLATLYDLHLPLLSLQCLHDGPKSTGESEE